MSKAMTIRPTSPAWIALVVALALSSGCQSITPPLRPDPGVTGYAYVNGYAVQRYLYAPNLVERAATEAMSDMKFHAVKRKVESNGVSLCGYTYDGRFITFTFEPCNEGTIGTVRVDTYGDEPISKILLDRTSIRLATLPQDLTPPLDPRALSDSILHRGAYIEGYRGAPLR